MKVTTEFLPTLSFEPESLAALTHSALEILTISHESNKDANITSSDCQSAIIIITDRAHGINENLTSLFDTSESIKIFINSNVNEIGFTGSIEREIACNSNGIWNNITSMSDSEAYELINGYYRVLAGYVRVTSPLWSETVTNPQGFISSGASLCQPVYKESDDTNGVLVNELLGVTCIDLPTGEVERLDPSGGMMVSSPHLQLSVPVEDSS